MDEEVDTPKPSKVKQLLPLVAMLFVGLGGGAGAMYFLAPPGAADAEDAEGGEGAHGEKAEAEGEKKEGEKAEADGEKKEGEHEAKAEGEKKEGEHEAEAEGEKKEGESKHSAKAEAPVDPTGTITNLGSFTINLRGSGGGRILRLEVQVDADAEAAATLKDLTPRIRDSVIAVVSDYTWSELEGTDGKTRLKDELLTRINGITDPVQVRSVYLTNFVVS